VRIPTIPTLARADWPREFRAPHFRRAADYGAEQGQQIEFADALEACGYGAPLMPENRKRLFPFFD